MTEIRLTNTKTRKKEVFTPIDPDNVRMYVCGPTVYDRAHLGNARPVIVFDVLYRLLRHVYGADHVTYVRNFTDVDDKINAEAQRRKAAGDPRSLEELIRERTEETIGWYHADMDALGALRPTVEPRATDFIGQMIGMIEGLIASGHAYAKDGHVLFRVRSYQGYGKLSGRTVDDMIAGARVEIAPFKEDPMDFVLWKPSDADLPGWESPWGRGRPGWHIECSAMSHELLGDSFDIHGGGIDLQFPHHENEIAQSKCAHPEAEFAKVWMHNEMLQVEGKKMSKSLGNFFTVRDLLDKGIPGEVIRFVFLSTHYSKPMDWTLPKSREAIRTLRDWISVAEQSAQVPNAEVIAALADDLNTSLAITKLHELFSGGSYAELTASAKLLGFDLLALKSASWATPFERRDLVEWLDYNATVGSLGWGHFSEDTVTAIHNLLRRWMTLRWEAKWSQADDLKRSAELIGLRFEVSKSKDGTSSGTAHIEGDFDPAKLEALK
ncbi:cysteinyl-tRNA synthetase [Defluviimonas denitrificans]|jgi:cysteinyl-tRNA synthetase|uniref:Cysteine--tRNA ligase n=1 Tax=Albidovulum denitrificans TaxID=404881 RepID=A0A2S8SC97_9RHOB|nr:cysteine--tRNA ligase [Defluviimonas denitrificans]PQV58455.1 cysteinyl-tRNA synthetase [Defluviimonas denitrificans]